MPTSRSSATRPRPGTIGARVPRRVRRHRRDPAAGDRGDPRLRARRRARARAAPATCGSRPRRRGSVSPRSCSGSSPAPGGTQRLPRLVGPARAKELVWSGRQVRADEALAIGLVDRVVPAEELEEHALAWAGELASGAVVAMGSPSRRSTTGSTARSRWLDLEAEAFVEVFGTEDARTASPASSSTAPARPPSPAASDTRPRLAEAGEVARQSRVRRCSALADGPPIHHG